MGNSVKRKLDKTQNSEFRVKQSDLTREILDGLGAFSLNYRSLFHMKGYFTKKVKY